MCTSWTLELLTLMKSSIRLVILLTVNDRGTEQWCSHCSGIRDRTDMSASAHCR